MEREALRARLAALLPRTLWPLVQAGGGSGRVEGCVLFADVAGFTPLTGSLARIGKEGAEELTRILNAFFAAMIRVAHDGGGDVLRFGGDAMTLFVPSGPEVALGTALRMQGEAARFQSIETRGGTFALGMKIGIASGSVLLGTVGDGTVGRDYFAAGRALDLAAEAEHRASKGQVVLCPACAQALSREAAGLHLLEGGFRLIEGDAAKPGPPKSAWPGGKGLPTPPSLEALQAFLPAFVVEKAALEEGLSVAEHRRTTVLFCSFAGIDYDGDAGAAAVVDQVYRRIGDAVRKFGGWVNKLDMGDKGSKAVGLFGAPFALENQEESACRAALALLEDTVLRGRLTDLRIGVTASPLFAAYVGADERREYTVMGDGINMAARLMANAHSWRILCGREVMEKASSALAFRELDPIFVKGKAEKVSIFRPEGEREELAQEARANFVGREELRRKVLPGLLRPDAPVVLALVGAPGVGKTALLHQVGVEMAEGGVRHITVPLVAHSVHSYLSAWRPVLFAALGVSRDAPAPIREEALRAGAAGEDPEYLPLFNVLLGTEIPETDASRALSAKDRKDALFAMLVRLFVGQTEAGPYGIFLDHLEHADPASLELLKLLVPEVGERPLKLVAAFRTQAEAALGEAAALFEKQSVGPMTPAEVRDYLLQVAGAAPPPDAVLDFLMRRAGGNPKFLEQILDAMKAAGVLAPGPSGLLEVDEDRLAATAFPDTLEGLLLSRANGLPEAERSLLKAASVLGASFSLNLLQTLMEVPQEALLEGIRSLEEQGILKMDTWGRRPYATFLDSLLRDALYESLNFSVKRSFHARVAALLEEEGAREPRLWPALARHFEAAGDDRKACHYLWSAAHEARARYDNAQAFQFLTRYVELSDRLGADPATDVQFRKGLNYLADSSNILGRLEEADAFSQRVLDAVKEPCEESVVSMMRLADNRRRRGDLSGSLELYGQANERALELGNRSLQCRILLDSGVPFALSGQMDKAMKQFQTAARMARSLEECGSLVVALMNQGLVFYHSGGRYKRAVIALKRAREVARTHELRPNLVVITMNLAQAFFDLGNYRNALSTARQGFSLARQFGYRSPLVALMGNVALHRAMLGEWDKAESDTKDAMSAARHYRMSASVASSLHIHGLLLAVGGDYAASSAAHLDSLEQHQALQNIGEAIGCLSEIIAISIQLKQGPMARTVLEKCSDLLESDARSSGNAWSIGFRAHLSAYRVLSGQIPLENGHQEIEVLLTEADQFRSLWLVAEVGEVLVRILRQAGKEEEAALAGLRVYPRVMHHYCPLYVTPFLLTLAEALLATDRFAMAEEVLKILRRQAKVLDRGLMGLRYRLLLADVSARQGKPRTVSRARKEAKVMAQGLVNLQKEEPFRGAVLALPEVRRVLS